MKPASMLSLTIGRLVVARAIAKEISGVTAARIYIQIGDDGPSYELGSITATRRHTDEEIKKSIHDLLIRIAERWRA